MPHTALEKVLRYALIGLVASILFGNAIQFFACCENTTSRILDVMAADGLRGPFGHGLKTRLMVNGVQVPMFVVLMENVYDLRVVPVVIDDVVDVHFGAVVMRLRTEPSQTPSGMERGGGEMEL